MKRRAPTASGRCLPFTGLGTRPATSVRWHQQDQPVPACRHRLAGEQQPGLPLDGHRRNHRSHHPIFRGSARRAVAERQPRRPSGILAGAEWAFRTARHLQLLAVDGRDLHRPDHAGRHGRGLPGSPRADVQKSAGNQGKGTSSPRRGAAGRAWLSANWTTTARPPEDDAMSSGSRPGPASGVSRRSRRRARISRPRRPARRGWATRAAAFARRTWWAARCCCSGAAGAAQAGAAEGAVDRDRWHNVEGATALSDADGAGAIDAFAAPRARRALRLRHARAGGLRLGQQGLPGAARGQQPRASWCPGTRWPAPARAAPDLLNSSSTCS